MILDKSEMERFDIKEGDTEAFVNFPLGLAKVKMSIFLKEYDGLYRVSIRSKRGISSNRLACRYFNGGGHFLASGGKLFIGSDIADAASAAAYIESCTEQFFKDENY